MILSWILSLRGDSGEFSSVQSLATLVATITRVTISGESQHMAPTFLKFESLSAPA